MPDDYLPHAERRSHTITDWIIAAMLVAVIVWCFWDAGWFL